MYFFFKKRTFIPNVGLFCVQRAVGGGVIVKNRGHHGKLVVWHSDCVFLTAKEVVGFPRRIIAVTVVTDSYGAAKEAGGSAKVAGTGVSDVVVSADWLF